MTTAAHRGPGRPSTGVRVDIRIPAELLARVDEIANTFDLTRAEVLRGIVADNVEIWWPN